MRSLTKLAFNMAFAAIIIPNAASCSAAPAPEPASSWIKISGPDELVIPAERFTCSKPERPGDGSAAADVPDAPPRFVRLASGVVMMVAAHHNNIPWFTKDLTSYSRKGCASILPSPENPDPAAFDDQLWIAGFYTKDGTKIFSLVHNEYHGAAHIPECMKRLTKDQNYWAPVCLQISMKGFTSKDGGKSFAEEPASAPVLASTNDKLDASNYGTLTRIGIHDPSNIVHNPRDGYFYFVSNVDPSANQQRGMCVFRSKDPLTSPWYAWDGKSFSARMGSPYAGQGARCEPVRKWGTYISALSYNTALNKFLAVGRSDTHQLVALTSSDLIDWDKETNLRPSVQANWWKKFSGDPNPDSYWTIIDPGSKSRFFDTSGANPYVYYVSWRTNLLGPQSRSRDIRRFQLSIKP